MEIFRGYEAGRTYFLDYSNRDEFLVKLGDDLLEVPPTCQRSHLSMDFITPLLPKMIVLPDELIDGVVCNHYVRDEVGERFHVYFTTDDRGNHVPRRLVAEEVDSGSGGATVLMTYDYVDFKIGGVDHNDKDYWDVARITDGRLVKEDCERHIGGFPYLHLFHYFFRV